MLYLNEADAKAIGTKDFELFQEKANPLKGRKEEPVFVLPPNHLLGGKCISSVGHVGRYIGHEFELPDAPYWENGQPEIQGLNLKVKDYAELLLDTLFADSPRLYALKREEVTGIFVHPTYNLFVGERDVNTGLEVLGTIFHSPMSYQKYKDEIARKVATLSKTSKDSEFALATA